MIIPKTLLLLCALTTFQLVGQKDSLLTKSSTYSALEWRNVGPAITSGRIADIVIHPDDNSVMYIAVGSGGVWKTVNAGTTYEPIFDGEATYSIGCVTIDPRNPHILWVGTGENVGGRHVGFGDGIYKSDDDGASWTHMGLKESEHISRIIVHPENSDIIYVAVQGPLWSKGGERGLFKSTDGGKTWEHKLGDDEWTGVTEVAMDPDNSDVLYAATWDRHRTVAAYMGGGPGSGIHKSTDGGETWTKTSKGLPMSNLGKIGLAISPFNSDVIYAAIETDRKTGGLYISRNRGASWSRQSDMTSGGTGPHYYQELYCDPHHEGTIYLMNNNVLVSKDHGKTYERINEKNKHVDTHAIAWRADDPDYIIMGTDGGLYETWDMMKTWRYTRNLPITQYYKVAVDDTEPFYRIYGGTQDNGSHGGPSQTLYEDGIRNRHWDVVLGADGHQSATEPGNPNITYGEFQEGFLWRIDHKTGETTYIRPEVGPNEPYERFNWDAPILVSAHDPARIYFASQRVWRSDNRGDDWTAISTDLTKNQNRIELPIMGKQQSWDNSWDVDAMSNYNTITSLGESPINENLLYAGTDDGHIQVTTDGGQNWTNVDYSKIKDLPNTAFVNDIRADLHNECAVYACLDNHKYGDFKPYIFKSTDMGKTWKSIANNLPEKLLIWRIVQDHVDPNLLYLATEYGVYFSNNGGDEWTKLSSGMPTIAIRDITIQRREDDLVAASFGRGFYILDDISALRGVKDITMETTGKLFPAKPAHWYAAKQGMYGQGDNEYKANNPPYGATFTYFMREGLADSAEKVRKDAEKKLAKDKKNIPFPGYEALDDETAQEQGAVYLTIKDGDGNVIMREKGSASKGMNRTTWDLSMSSNSAIHLESSRGGGGYEVTPGTYNVTLSMIDGGEETVLDGPMNFEVERLMESTLQGASYDEMNSFRAEYEAFTADLRSTNRMLSQSQKIIKAMTTAFSRADQQSYGLMSDINALKEEFRLLNVRMNGNKSKREIGEKQQPTPGDANLIGWVAIGGTYGPTGNHIKAFNRAVGQLSGIKADIESAAAKIITLRERLDAAGAPPIED